MNIKNLLKTKNSFSILKFTKIIIYLKITQTLILKKKQYIYL